MVFNLPKRNKISNKGSFGKVLNIAGSKYMRGAAYLSSISALKVGCGYSILASINEVLTSVSSLAPEVVLAPLDDIETLIKDIDVISIGCGLSTNNDSKQIFNKLIHNNIKCPLIIDADGLNILSQMKNPKLPKHVILTPHPKEAERLLNVNIEKIIKNTEFYAKELSKKYNCVAVLKTHETVVSSTNFETYKNMTGNNCLAKAGSGDVLTGMIAGFIAQKMDCYEASKLAVYLHGLTGDIAKNELTEYGVLASDLVKYIPLAIKTLIP